MKEIFQKNPRGLSVFSAEKEEDVGKIDEGKCYYYNFIFVLPIDIRD